jgi:hypothetical protein
MNIQPIRPLNFYASVPATEYQMKALMTFMMDKYAAANIYDDVKEEFGVKVAEKRCEALGINIDKAVLLMVSAILPDNPATIVMYLHAIYQEQLRSDSLDMRFSIEEFCELFPNGYPTKETLSVAWDAQKYDPKERPSGQPDNRIDNPEHFKAKAPYEQQDVNDPARIFLDLMKKSR